MTDKKLILVSILVNTFVILLALCIPAGFIMAILTDNVHWLILTGVGFLLFLS